MRMLKVLTHSIWNDFFQYLSMRGVRLVHDGACFKTRQDSLRNMLPVQHEVVQALEYLMRVVSNLNLHSAVQQFNLASSRLACSMEEVDSIHRRSAIGAG